MAREYEYHYGICTEPDDVLFVKQCRAIEANIPNLNICQDLEDVDGSLTRIYHHDKGDIKVSNDRYIGALYVEADFDLLSYFH